MSLITTDYGYWDDWLLYHKVIFDGGNRRIYIADEVTTLSVKIDLYSSWKEWLQLRDHAKFSPAFRTIGGDSLGGGLYAGDIYFLINGWQIVLDQNVKVAGILYHDDPLDPFIIMPGGGLTATVSSLAYAYNTIGATVPTVQEIRQELDANSSKLTVIDNNVATLPTAIEIRQEIDTNSVKLVEISDKVDAIPTATENATTVWNTDISTLTDKTKIGGYISKVLLSIPKFLGLK